jgi:hypothetical protein
MRRFLIIGLMAVALLALAACGGNGDTADTPAQPTQETPTTQNNNATADTQPTNETATSDSDEDEQTVSPDLEIEQETPVDNQQPGIGDTIVARDLQITLNNVWIYESLEFQGRQITPQREGYVYIFANITVQNLSDEEIGTFSTIFFDADGERSYWDASAEQWARYNNFEAIPSSLGAREITEGHLANVVPADSQKVELVLRVVDRSGLPIRGNFVFEFDMP